MKYLMLILLSTIITSCGSNNEAPPLEAAPTEEVQVPTPMPEVIETIVEVETIIETPITQQYERLWQCENGASIEFIQAHDSSVFIPIHDQMLLFKNFDNSIAVLPKKAVENLNVSDNSIIYAYNLRYRKNTNNVKSQIDEKAINGNFETVFEYFIMENNNLKINIKIFDKVIGESDSSLQVETNIHCN